MAVKDAGRAARSAGRVPPSREPARQPDSPELIQLLTPEGERVEHPDYPLEISAAEVRALYRDLVIVRRIDFEAIALQRQGELGRLHRSGPGERSARATWPSRPTASTAWPGAAAWIR